jgi:hypothetical protein
LFAVWGAYAFFVIRRVTRGGELEGIKKERNGRDVKGGMRTGVKEGNEWEIIGECYIYGLMGGEAMETLPEEKVQEFHFR